MTVRARCFSTEDTRPQDSAAPLQDSDVAMTKSNYQQTTPAAKMLVGPWYLDEFGNPTRKSIGSLTIHDAVWRDGALSKLSCVLAAVCRSIPSALAMAYAVSPFSARCTIFWRIHNFERSWIWQWASLATFCHFGDQLAGPRSWESRNVSISRL